MIRILSSISVPGVISVAVLLDTTSGAFLVRWHNAAGEEQKSIKAKTRAEATALADRITQKHLNQKGQS